MLRVLGSQATAPLNGIAASGYALESGQDVFMIDCGSGTFNEFTKHYALEQLKGIILTHLHADHCLDLMAIAYRWTFPEVRPKIPLYIPAGEHSKHKAYDELFAVPSIEAMKTPIATAFEIHEMPCDGKTEFQLNKNTTLLSFAGHHAVPNACLRFSVGSKVVAFSGDTGPCQGLDDAVHDADIFICEATYLQASDEQIYGHGHMTAELAGAAAHNNNVKQLVLTHFTDVKAQGAQGIQDAKHKFNGHIALALPGEEIS
ncbi:MAG: MBL fold metallo-hydrolase [Micrococcaceae bacterium]